MNKTIENTRFSLVLPLGWVLPFFLSFPLKKLTESRVLRCKRGLRSPQATRGLIPTDSSFDLGPILFRGASAGRWSHFLIGAPLVPCRAAVADQIKTLHQWLRCIRTSSRHDVRPSRTPFAPASLCFGSRWSDPTRYSVQPLRSCTACCAPNGPDMLAGG